MIRFAEFLIPCNHSFKIGCNRMSRCYKVDMNYDKGDKDESPGSMEEGYAVDVGDIEKFVPKTVVVPEKHIEQSGDYHYGDYQNF